ncbi:MAG: hypothetical protein LCI00_29210 [Chloroflexi bacterium]|nr:hypothetical protein [Chloroflexota bacterium]MCC6894787.1 hypothetical protein [Anaerolineae bacterium]
MPYQLDWYIENEILYSRYFGTVTPDDMQACLQKAMEMIESSPREIVHSINDVGDVLEAVSMKDSMTILRKVGTHPRAGWSFSIREKSRLIKMTGAMGSSLFKLRYRAFETLEEALEYLKGFDQNISWDRIEPQYSKQPVQ